MKVSKAGPVPAVTEAQWVRCPGTSSFAVGEREAIKKSVSRSCLLDRESVEELSDSAGEEVAEAME